MGNQTGIPRRHSVFRDRGFRARITDVDIARRSRETARQDREGARWKSIFGANAKRSWQTVFRTDVSTGESRRSGIASAVLRGDEAGR